MSENRLFSKHSPTRPDDDVNDPERILADLRAFATELGVHGCSAMTKEELVESLRQRYVLDSLLNSSAPSADRVHPPRQRSWRH
jgi:Rho termination factor, N-terminal domain